MKLSKIRQLSASVALALSVAACGSKQTLPEPTYHTIRVATFNVSMEANNYMGLADGAENLSASSNILANELASGTNQQIKNVAEIIQRVNPDILLLNEFDHIEDTQKGIETFSSNYLQQSQNNQTPIVFPYSFTSTVNTGTPTPLFNNVQSKLRTFGFGHFAGQYGMALLSKHPIEPKLTRTFQNFLWKDMPNHLIPKNEDGSYWYSAEEINVMRLSSKSHWDITLDVCGKALHILASHPTPPVFDGPEDRNGRRNHDELRFWADYISANRESYHRDDNGALGGLDREQSFVILGDMNASSVEGDAYPNAIEQLLLHPRVNNYVAPESDGGKQNKKESKFAASHTAKWGMRADYVLPSADIDVVNSGVFWPTEQSELNYLVSGRAASSDHRLVWVDIRIPAECSIEQSKN